MSSGPHTGFDNDCIQEVTMFLPQPIPDIVYYAFSLELTESCVGLRGLQAVDITTGKSEPSLTLTVNVGSSGLDTRQQIYIISWFVIKDIKGPCSRKIPLQRTG